VTNHDYNQPSYHYLVPWGSHAPKVIYAGPTTGKDTLIRRMLNAGLQAINFDDIVISRLPAPLRAVIYPWLFSQKLIDDQSEQWQIIKNTARDLFEELDPAVQASKDTYLISGLLDPDIIPYAARKLGLFRTRPGRLAELFTDKHPGQQMLQLEAERWVKMWLEARSTFPEWYELGDTEFLTDFIGP